MSEMLIYINRKSGVAHADFWCDALQLVPTDAVRVEAYDPDRPRRKCSRCWDGYAARPRRSDLAVPTGSVTERSEGNPHSGLTGRVGTAPAATERARRGTRSRPDTGDAR